VRIPIDEKSYDMIPILDEPWVAVAARQLEIKQARSIHLADLKEPSLLLMHRQNGTRCHDMVLDEMGKTGIDPNIFCESDNVTALLTLGKMAWVLSLSPNRLQP
jgi:DNA-binding transcriptional LysR family regulator